MILTSEEEKQIRDTGIRGTDNGRKSRGMILDFASYNKNLPRPENDGINTFVTNTIENYITSNQGRHEIGVTQLCGLSESQYTKVEEELNQILESGGGKFSVRIDRNYINVPLPFFSNPVLIADMIIFDNDCAHLGEYRDELQLTEAK